MVGGVSSGRLGGWGRLGGGTASHHVANSQHSSQNTWRTRRRHTRTHRRHIADTSRTHRGHVGSVSLIASATCFNIPSALGREGAVELYETLPYRYERYNHFRPYRLQLYAPHVCIHICILCTTCKCQ